MLKIIAILTLLGTSPSRRRNPGPLEPGGCQLSPHHTSQECANCGHIHADNRKSQSLFQCVCCNYTDNADNNASAVIRKRAINLILDSGTELSDKGVLRPASDIGREFSKKTHPKTKCAQTKKRQKRQLSLAA